MLPISELVRVARSCDESWHSPLADRAAQLWGFRTPLFVRSSANHVFVARPAVLRLRPASSPGVADQLEVVARWSTALAVDGAPVAGSLPSWSGRLVEAVNWEGADYLVSAYEAIEGDTREDDVTLDDVRAWGAGLASLHALPTDPERLPSWADRVAAAGAGELLDGLPRDPGYCGAVHGDPELDNVVWSPATGPVFVDLDDAALGWYAADVAFALRDFAPIGCAPSLSDGRVAAFVAGYRDVRRLDELELSWLPLFARAHAAVELARLQPVLAETIAPDWPAWARALADRIADRAVALASVVNRPLR